MKLVIKLVVVLVLLVVILAIVGFIFVDSIAKAAIEKGGTYALGVDTTVDTADVGVFGGTFEMSQLEVANPEGFDAPHFLELATGGVAVTLGSLMSETIELETLELDGLDVHLQRTGAGANYQAILDHLKQFESEEPTEDGKRFTIREVVISNVTVHVDMLPVGGSLTQVNVPIDELRLENVGSDSNRGLLLADLVGVIVKAVFAAVVDKGGDLLPTDLLGDLSGGLAGLRSLGDMGINSIAELGDVSGLLEGVGDGLGDVGDRIGESVGDALEGLRDGGNPLDNLNLPGGGGGGDESGGDDDG